VGHALGKRSFSWNTWRLKKCFLKIDFCQETLTEQKQESLALDFSVHYCNEQLFEQKLFVKKSKKKETKGYFSIRFLLLV
jgi:hypothetical protein